MYMMQRIFLVFKFSLIFTFAFYFVSAQAAPPVDVSVEDLWMLHEKGSHRPLSATRKDQFGDAARVDSFVAKWRALAEDAEGVLTQLASAFPEVPTPEGSPVDCMFETDEELAAQSYAEAHDLVRPDWLESGEALQRKLAGTPHKYGEKRSGEKHAFIPFKARGFATYVMLALLQLDVAHHHGKLAFKMPAFKLLSTAPGDAKLLAAWGGDQRNYVSTPAYIMQDMWGLAGGLGVKPDICYWSVAFHHTNSRATHSKKKKKRSKRREVVEQRGSLPKDFKYSAQSYGGNESNQLAKGAELLPEAYSEGDEVDSDGSGGAQVVSARRKASPLSPKEKMRHTYRGGPARSRTQKMDDLMYGSSVVSQRRAADFRKHHPGAPWSDDEEEDEGVFPFDV